jgi:hypothetical protein
VQKESEFIKTPQSYKKSISLKEKDLSPMDKLKSIKGEASQGQYLINAKERNSESKNKPSNKFSQQRRAKQTYSSTSKMELRCDSGLPI